MPGIPTTFPSLSSAIATASKSSPKNTLLHYEIPKGMALFMRGATSDLVQAVGTDKNMGIERLAVIDDDHLEVRHIRQSLGCNGAVSIFGNAGKKTYWSKVTAYPPEEAPRQKSWALMASVEAKLYVHRPTATARQFSVIEMDALSGLIEKCRNVQPWL